MSLIANELIKSVTSDARLKSALEELDAVRRDNDAIGLVEAAQTFVAKLDAGEVPVRISISVGTDDSDD